MRSTSSTSASRDPMEEYIKTIAPVCPPDYFASMRGEIDKSSIHSDDCFHHIYRDIAKPDVSTPDDFKRKIDAVTSVDKKLTALKNHTDDNNPEVPLILKDLKIALAELKKYPNIQDILVQVESCLDSGLKEKPVAWRDALRTVAETSNSSSIPST